MYFITYAKFVDDDETGIALAGVYFGGAADTLEDAESQARTCINSIRGGIIITKIASASDQLCLQRVMSESVKIFSRKEEQMQETHQIMNKPRRRR